MTHHRKAKGYVLAVVLKFMQRNCYGFRSAMIKDIILSGLRLTRNLDIGERTLRRALSELRKEGHLASHNSDPKGWWFIPLQTKDREEINAVIRCLVEKKSKALDMIVGVDRRIKEYEDRIATGNLF